MLNTKSFPTSISKLFIFFVTCIILSSCTRDVQNVELDIQFELSDNVAPLDLQLFVDTELIWADWYINDTLRKSGSANDDIAPKFNLRQGETIKVDFEGKGANKIDYYASTEIDIPELAQSLVIEGFEFEENYDFNIGEEDLEFRFSYYNQNGSTPIPYITTVTNADFQNGQATFSEPVIIDISNYAEFDRERTNVYLYIRGQESNKIYFQQNFYIYATMFIEKFVWGDTIKLKNFRGDNKEAMDLHVDWTN